VIEIIQEYWKSLLWTDGYRFTGVAITLWLLISSVVMGGIMAVFMAIGRVSSNKYIQFPIWLFTYIFAVRRCMCSCWCFTQVCTRWKL
jgi:histidine transport system permease protein